MDQNPNDRFSHELREQINRYNHNIWPEVRILQNQVKSLQDENIALRCRLAELEDKLDTIWSHPFFAEHRLMAEWDEMKETDGLK
jgi:regulator of replication initiation timing